MEELNEVVEEKNWFGRTKDKFKTFCKEHPDIILTVLGGAASLVGGAMKLIAVKNEYSDEVYVTDGDDVYKVPARQMKSKKTVKIK